jgi:CHAD domain-containing protein
MTQVEAQIHKLSQRLGNLVRKVNRNASPGAVHHLRTTIRRLEAVLDYSGLTIDAKQERALRRVVCVRKRAGKVRDVDAQLMLLGAIANRSCMADVTRLRELAQRKREKRVATLISALRKLERSRFAGHLNRISDNTSSASQILTDPDAPLHEAMQQLHEMKADFALHPRLGAKKLHAVRIRLKKVRYLAEVAAASESKTQFLSDIKLIQDAVGEWHDWELLAHNARKQFRNRQNCPLLTEILSLFACRRTTAVSQLRAYLSRETPPARKQPRPSLPVRALAQRA